MPYNLSTDLYIILINIDLQPNNAVMECTLQLLDCLKEKLENCQNLQIPWMRNTGMTIIHLRTEVANRNFELVYGSKMNKKINLKTRTMMHYPFSQQNRIFTPNLEHHKKLSSIEGSHLICYS